MNKVGKNFLYQAIFQITKLIIPVISIPIVSKAIGPEGVGKYNYANSVVQYFILCASLGIALYGNREIAISWSKKKQVSETFWEIFLLKAILTILLTILYLLFILVFNLDKYFIIQSLVLISVLFDISWFFMGIEDFKKTSIRSLIIQIITFICIVFFIKDKSDTFLYTVIQSISAFFSQILIWPFVFKYISLKKIKLSNCLRRFTEALQFFIPQAAITIYTNLNKTLVGFFIGSAAVGLFTNSLQLNNVFITLITTLDVVLLPHMSSLFAKNNQEKIIETMENTIHLQLFFSVPIMFGMLTVYDKLVPWFFGDEFIFINKVVPIFSILIIIVPLGMAISRQYLMPIGKISEYNKSVITGAIISIVLNIILIPTIGFFGVVIAYITAECFVTMVRMRSFVKTTNFVFYKKKIMLYVLSATVMCITTRLLTRNMDANLVTTLLQVLIAVPIYWAITSFFNVNVIKKRKI